MGQEKEFQVVNRGRSVPVGQGTMVEAFPVFLGRLCLTREVGCSPGLCKQDPASETRVLNKGPQGEGSKMEKGGIRNRKPEKRLQELLFQRFSKGLGRPREGPRVLASEEVGSGRLAGLGKHLTFPQASALPLSCSFTLMVTPRKWQIWGRRAMGAIFRLLKGKSDAQNI